jgi:hypothetical protein
MSMILGKSNGDQQEKECDGCGEDVGTSGGCHGNQSGSVYVLPNDTSSGTAMYISRI